MLPVDVHSGSKRSKAARCDASRPCGLFKASSHFEDHLDFHGGVVRQLPDANGRAGMPTGLLPEDLHQQVGGTVDDGGLGGEILRTMDKAR